MASNGKHRITRRDFLRLASLGLGAAACTGTSSDAVPDAGAEGGRTDGGGRDVDAKPPPPATRDLAAIPASESFMAGVMAGDALSDRAILWTKYTGPNQLVVYVQEAGGNAVYEADATLADGNVAHVDATELTAGTRYEYAFLERTAAGTVVARSAVGKFRAALAEGALEPVTFAGVSCTSQYRETTSANLGRLAERTDLSFVLHAGDHLYADFPTEDPALTLADYRAKYAYAWSRPGMKALHQSVGMYNTWDDHEVYNNWQGGTTTARAVAGVQTFFEHQPIRRIASAPNQLWRSFRWGRTLELFVIDGRGERNAAAGKYMSDAQLTWLTNGLTSSQAVFKLILNSCPIGLFPDGINEWRSPTDRWANPAFSAQRTSILDVSQQVGGVWWLSGDFHFGTVGRVQYPDTTKYGRVREILMGAGGSGLGSSAEIPGSTRIAQIQSLDNTNTHWTMATPENNYVVIRANPVPDATHAKPWLQVAYYDATTQLMTGEYGLL